jgi:two-component system sensor histidine kinase DesK
MKAWLRKIDRFLLPRGLKEDFSPYVWLIYMPLFFVPVFAFSNSVLDKILTASATVAFLVVYFHSHWVSHNKVILHIVMTIALGTLSAFVTPSASALFIYGAAFCSRLRPIKYAFSVVLIILLWAAFISWYWDFAWHFSMPALVFSFIIGFINIYQSVLSEKKQELYLSNQEVQRLAKVAERERIARDLHDLIGHTFSVITLKADLAGRLLDKDLEKARQEINQLETISRDALSQVREVVSGYRTSDLLSELANAKHVFASLDIDFDCQFENFDNMPASSEDLDLYLSPKGNKELAIMLRELVTNIVKHAGASKVEVIIKRSDESIVLFVKDNGQGFGKEQSEGVGLKSIQERVSALKGYVKFTNGPSNQGICSEIALPLAAQVEAPNI